MQKQKAIKPPSKLDTAFDALRAVKDVASLVSERSLLKRAPQGDGPHGYGHPRLSYQRPCYILYP